MRRGFSVGTAVACLMGSALVGAQEPTPQERRVVVGEQFRRGGLYRLLFGANYRDLWTTPVDLPVLDLATFAGGLTPTRRVGHGQTQALAFKGQDGLAYTFRPIVKDPVGLLPIELRETLAAGFIRDQMSSQHPAGHVVVPPLARALGLLHNTPRLVILPDDERLGEYRTDFRDVVGDIEEFVGQKGYGGSLESLKGDEMWARLDGDPGVRVDSRAYLRARLLDHLIGDWDRHRGQWTFARLPGVEKWQPIPEDRDQAFVRFQGLALAQIRGGLPLLVSFGRRYPSLDGLTFDSWDVDRRLLNDLERRDWDEVAADAQARLTDAVLEEAVARLPAAYRAQEGAEMLAALRARRDALRDQAARFYRFLAAQVDVRGTERAERVEVTRFEGGDVEVALRDGDAAEPWFRRRFRRGETDEVRLLLLGGDDQVVARGPRGGVTVRVVGGAGRDTVDDAAAGGLRVSDSDETTRVTPGPGTRHDRRVYAEPPPNPRAAWVPARDWGRRTIVPMTRLTYESDIGALVSLGLGTTGYGFRKDPYADKQSLRLSYSSARQDGRFEYSGDFRRENSSPHFGLRVQASGLELLHFYGFGNETPDLGADDDAFHEVEQNQALLAPELRLPLGGRGQLALGPVARFASTERQASRLIGRLRPYGAGDFAQAGLRAEAEVDTRDRIGLPTRGAQLSAGGSYYPAWLDVERAFGEAHGEARVWWGARGGLAPALALHAGGKRVWGRYPFHEAAFLGGGDSLRGLRRQRYAGDSAVWGGAELRLALADAFLLVPGEVGLFGLADVGRVWLEGEDSDRWHRGFGAGLYFASPEGRSSVSLAVSRAEGRTGFYLRTGLGF
jgi:hypothetical protein